MEHGSFRQSLSSTCRTGAKLSTLSRALASCAVCSKAGTGAARTGGARAGARAIHGRDRAPVAQVWTQADTNVADLAASPAFIPAVRYSARLSGLREHLQRGNARDRAYGARHERTTQPLQRHRHCRVQWRLPSRPGRVRGGSRPGRHGAGPRASSARTWLTRSSAWSRSPRPIATQPWPSPGLSYPMLSSVRPCHPVGQQTTVPSIVPSPRQEWRCITYRPDNSALGDNRGLLSSQRRGDPLITARRYGRPETPRCWWAMADQNGDSVCS